MSSPTNRTTPDRLHSSSSSAVLVGLLSFMLSSGCTEVPGSVEEGPDNVEETISGGVVDGEGEGSPSVSPGRPTAFPADLDNDDREGLVVTGLDGLSAADVVSPWLAMTRTFRSVGKPEQSGNGVIELTRYSDDFPVSAHLAYLDIPLDICRVPQLDGANDDDDENLPPPTISGGASVVFNTPAGPWFTYSATYDDDIVYRAVDQLTGAFPEDISLSIPGLSFPTVAAYPLYEPEPVERILPDVEGIATGESLLQWVAGHQNTLIKIDWLAFDDDDDFAGFPVTCLVRDDGAFVPDAVARLALASSTHRHAVRYSRVYSRLDVLNGIVFYQEVEVAE